MSKQVAASLTGILSNPVMVRIMDLGANIVQDTLDYLKHWSMDLYTRKPGPALDEDGEFKGTDLDLATFLTALAERRAVITIPNYQTYRVATQREGEKVNKESRRGQLTGLYANKDTFNFGINMIDYGVTYQDPETGRESIGAPRKFTLTDGQGAWFKGWENIQFDPSAKENDFLNDKRLWTGSSVIFSNFVSPNRHRSLYGKYYLITKAMIERLTLDVEFLNGEIKRLLDAGITYPPTGSGAKKDWPESKKVGEEKEIEIDAHTFEIDLPDFTGTHQPVANTQEALVRATEQRREIVYHTKPALSFAVRAVELAFVNFLKGKTLTDTLPGWISGAKWEENYVIPGKRNKWDRLVLFQPAPGQLGVSIRHRKWPKKEKVAAHV